MIETNSITLFREVPYQDASAEVKEIYDETMREFQIPFVLNWFKCQGANATLLKGNWEKLKSTLLRGTVPNVLKQLIIYQVSAKRGCNYCAQAHKIFADSMGASLSDDPNFKITENINSQFVPQSYRVALEVTTKAALNAAELNQEDYAKLLEVGFTPEESIELLAQADLVNMLNTIADVSGIKLDNELAASA